VTRFGRGLRNGLLINALIWAVILLILQHL
jgi:hypothetical protein